MTADVQTNQATKLKKLLAVVMSESSPDDRPAKSIVIEVGHMNEPVYFSLIDHDGTTAHYLGECTTCRTGVLETEVKLTPSGHFAHEPFSSAICESCENRADEAAEAQEAARAAKATKAPRSRRKPYSEPPTASAALVIVKSSASNRIGEVRCRSCHRFLAQSEYSNRRVCGHCQDTPKPKAAARACADCHTSLDGYHDSKIVCEKCSSARALSRQRQRDHDRRAKRQATA